MSSKHLLQRFALNKTRLCIYVELQRAECIAWDMTRGVSDLTGALELLRSMKWINHRRRPLAATSDWGHNVDTAQDSESSTEEDPIPKPSKMDWPHLSISPSASGQPRSNHTHSLPTYNGLSASVRKESTSGEVFHTFDCYFCVLHKKPGTKNNGF